MLLIHCLLLSPLCVWVVLSQRERERERERERGREREREKEIERDGSLTTVVWLSVFCVSSSRSRGLVCGL